MNNGSKLKCVMTKLAASVAAICVISVPVTAARVPQITIEGEEYKGDVKLVGDTTYVRLREFSEEHGAGVTWDQSEALAGAFTGNLAVLAVNNAPYIKANGRYLWCSGGAFIENGRMYVPLRAIGSAFGYETDWDSGSFSASMTKTRGAIEHGDSYYSGEDLYWLSRIISAEAEGESLHGKLAVGSVVLNRVESDKFPNTVRGVVFDRKNGVQFTPVSNGTIYKTPDAESIIAAKLCLEGTRVNRDMLFFINVSLADSFWITQNRKYVMTVGRHDFYA